MKESNICKFVLSKTPETMETQNFVLESDENVMFNEHPCKDNRLILVIEGSGTFIINSVPFEAKIGTLLFSFDGERMHVDKNDNLQFIYIDFKGGKASSLFDRFAIAPSRRIFENMQNLIPFVKTALTSANDDNIDIISESVVLYVFSNIKKDTNKKNDLVYELIRHIEKNFFDRTLNLESLSKKWGYHSKYLSSEFKKRVGVGFSAFLKNTRLKHAVFLMDNGVASIKNVAFLCGFDDPLYFSKVFKETVGVTPKQYISKL